MRRLSPQALWTARALRFARHSLGVRFLVALALSALVWVGLTIEENPEATEPFPGRLIVEPVGLDTRSLVLVEEIAPVRVSVKGPKVNLASLTADHFVARVDLGGLGAGRHQVDVDVVVSDSQVEIVLITPANIAVELDPVVERNLRVNARIESDVATGYRADLSGITAEPADATVSGASSVVDQVARVQAALSLEDATRDVRVEGILIPVDRQGIEVEDVRVDPPTVLVNVPVNRITSRKRVPVVPRIEGTVAPSFFIARIGVVPTSVEIEGEPGALERVDAVETLPIDIADARGDIERDVGFEAPEGVTIRSDQPFAQVAVVVEPLDETTTIQVAVVLTNLGSGLQSIADQPFLQIVMTGPAEVLQGLRGGDILAEVDLSNRAPGLHQIRPVITNPAPDTLRMVRHTPAVVDVRISPLDAPSAAPATTAIPGPGGAVPAATPTPTGSAG
ncbi:MAG: CdaR family protein [Chloroflexi bacterium]|nr:CdaR family protein [Chloroflexota bacterium]